MDSRCSGRSIERMRPLEIQADFERICIWSVGQVHYQANGNVVTKNGALILDSSLAFCLDPSRLGDVVNRATLNLGQTGSDSPCKQLEGQFYIACNEGSGTWGHWIVHNLPRVVLFLEAYPNGRVVVPRSYFGAGIHSACGQVLELLGYPRERFVLVSPGEVLNLEETFFIDLLFQNGISHSLALDVLRRLPGIARNIVGNKQSGRLTFIRRLHENRREISNVELLSSALEQRNIQFYRCLPSLTSQIEVWRTSKIVTGVLGSDFTNMVFGGADRVLMITPEWFGDIFFYGLAGQLAVEWNEVFCGELVQRRNPIQDSSFLLDVGLYGHELDRMLDKVANA
jgi:hypothetical protein